MKKVIFILAMFYSSLSSAWWAGGYGGYGYGGYPPPPPLYGYGGFGYGGYGYGGFGYGGGYMIPEPSFNYSTVIQQSPPIIINNEERYERREVPLPPAPRRSDCYSRNSDCR